MQRSIRLFLALAAKPTESGVMNFLLLLVPTGAAVFGLFVSPWGWVGLVGLIAIAFGVAGVRLQYQLDCGSHLVFKKCDPRSEVFVFGPAQDVVQILSLPVCNEARRPLEKANVHNAVATVTYFEKDGTENCSFQGKWTSNDAIDSQGRYVPQLRFIPSSRLIEQIDIAIKSIDEDACYALNARSVRDGFRIDQLALRSPEHYVHVNVRGNDGEADGWFLLSNPGFNDPRIFLGETEVPSWA